MTSAGLGHNMKVKRRWDELVFGQNKGQGNQLPQEQEAMERGVRTVPLLQPSLKIVTLTFRDTNPS